MSGEPHIRKVRPEDLEEVWKVHVAASNDLMVRPPCSMSIQRIVFGL